LPFAGHPTLQLSCLADCRQLAGLVRTKRD